MYYSTEYASPLGPLTLAANGEQLIGLWMKNQKYFAAGHPESLSPKENLPIFSLAESWLNRYFAGECPSPHELPLAPAGSAFRQEVWKLLQEIPWGQVTTYGELAKKMAGKLGRATMSSQAVGGAVGHNPISIIIPCHRVVGAAGSLTGYAGGLEKKVRLLQHEGVDTQRFFLPKQGTAL